MKRIAAIAIIGWLLLAGSIWASQVTNVALSYQDGSTVARIDIQGPVRFTHQTEVPKDGRPDRVIVDVLSATHALGAKEFRGLPTCVVTGIRSSQFAVSPEKIVRIVFDLGTTPVYQVESDDHAITIKFNHKEAQSFAAWSSSGAPTPEPVQAKPVIAEAPRSTPPPPQSVAAKNELIEKDRLSSLAEKPKDQAPVKADPIKVVKEAPAVAPTPTDFSGRAFSDGWDNSEPWKPSATTMTPAVSPKPAPTTVAKAPATDSKPTAKATTEPAKVKPTKPVEAKPAAPKPEPILAAEPTQVKPVAEKPKVELAAKPEVVDKKVVPAKQELAAKPEVADKKVEPAKPELTFPPLGDKFAYPPLQFPTAAPATTPTASEPTALAAAPQAKPAEEKPSAVTAPTSTTAAPATAALTPELTPEQKAAEIGVEKTNLLVEADFAPAVELPATVKPEDMTKIAVVDDAAAKADKTPPRATARFRREAQSDKIRGTMVAEFPERLVIQYQTGGQRDPFDALIDDSKSFNNPVENRIPNVEGLKLVGILESEAGNNSALFEDKGGFSYILQSGDKVRNGYVLRVEPEQVYFQIFEYGWSRTVALTMEY